MIGFVDNVDETAKHGANAIPKKLATMARLVGFNYSIPEITDSFEHIILKASS